MIGVDVGGTFTDVVMLDPTGGITTVKVPSTSNNHAEGFARGLQALGVRLATVSRILHGTTVATNAAIERKGARTAGVFTKGFRDVLAIGTGQRFTGGLFDPRFRQTTPLVPRSLCFEMRERTDHKGRELSPLHERELADIAAQLEKASVEAVAICFLHSYADERHEVAVENYLREKMPNVFVCRSADVLPQIREYERFTTTAFNAYLGPVIGKYLSDLEDRLRESDYGRDLLLMTSNGGVISARHAARYPITTVLSGPAGGVSAGIYLGRALAIPDLITCDMGGTSTDVCLIKKLRPAVATQRIVGGLPLRIPQLDINTVGAGGGSIVRIDADGTVRVGPESAGAVPGPACYDRGAQEATVTDANVVLGRLSSGTLLGGSLRLRPDLAQSVVDKVADKLGLGDAHVAAEGIIRLAVSNMATAIREISVERGEDPRGFVLVACGGAGPMHGCEVAEHLGLSRVIVPLHPGNFSALGLLASDLRHEFLRSYLAPLAEADLDLVGTLLRQMADEGRALLASEGAPAEDMEIHTVLDLRFRGQAHQLGVEVDPARLTRDALAAEFQQLYYDTWSYRPDTTAVQIVNLRVTAIGKAPQLQLVTTNPAADRGRIADALKEIRPVYFEGRFHDTPIYERLKLPLQARLEGPAIIDEDGATTVVPPTWETEVHSSAHLFLHRKIAPESDTTGAGDVALETEVRQTGPETPLDPITVEVIHNALMSFIKEMRHSIVRTSFGPSLRERNDFSCALQASEGELVAIFQDNPPHIVPTVYAVRAARERFGDDIQPGDIILVNDPYLLGGHMNDVAHLYPIFANGRLVFWIVIRIHYTDIGGMAPGSITPDAVDVFQEGIRIPPVKAYEAGKPNQSFIDTLFANVRAPEERKADFTAVMASFWTSEKRLKEIFETHGVESVLACGEIVRDRAERRMRSAISQLPDGEYAYEVNLDSDGFERRWIPLRVRVRIEGDTMSVDFSDSASSVPGPMNGSEATAACAACVAAKGLLDPDPAVNGGSFRPIRIVTRPGTLFHALPPTPTCGSQDLMHRATAAVVAALAPVAGNQALGDHFSPGHHYMSGHDPQADRQFIMYDAPIGGTGAVCDHDGNNVLAGFERGDHARIMPIEIHESEFPFLAECNELRVDSGGAGRYRGGLGLRREWRLVRGSGTVTDMAEPSITPYHGLFGSLGGAASTTFVKRNNEQLMPGAQAGKVVRFPIREGDVVQILKWGAGGYGDPLERNPNDVVADLREGLVSKRAAHELYGVVISSGIVDLDATHRLRERVLSTRVYLKIVAVDTDMARDESRVWFLAPETAQNLGVSDGEPVECLTRHSAPLRGHVKVLRGQTQGELPAGPFARQVLRVDGGDKVWVRKLFDPMEWEGV